MLVIVLALFSEIREPLRVVNSDCNKNVLCLKLVLQ